MKWIVTSTPHANCTSVIGKHNFPGPVPNPVPDAEFPYEFRLLDGDGNEDLRGRCGDLDEADAQDAAFGPLDAFENTWGCTKMEYRRVGAKKWIEL